MSKSKNEIKASEEDHWQAVTANDLGQFMQELRTMATGLLRRNWDAQSITPSDLVQSAFRRQGLKDQRLDELTWTNRQHFFGAMFKAMNRTLMDHAKKRNAEKRKINDNFITQQDPPSYETTEELATREEIIEKREQLKIIQIGNLQFQDVVRAANEFPEQMLIFIDVLIDLEDERPEMAALVQHRLYGNLTLEQIAQMMEMSVKSVQRRWTKVRAWLHHEVSKRLNAVQNSPM